MTPFEFIRPATLAEAVAAGAEPDSRYLAGGTNLLDLMKLGVAVPRRLIDISRLPGLDRIEAQPDGGLRIGAMVRNSDLARDPAVLRGHPAVAEALLSGASAQLRNAATVGGNLLQQTRCPYFQDPAAACNRRDPGAGCEAIGGVTRGHAVLGWTETCIATHASDFCVPLAALDARVEIAGPGGTREVGMAELHPLPDEDSAGNPAIRPGEVLTALVLPPGSDAFAGHSRYVKLRERTSFAFAVVSAAAMLDMDGGTIRAGRLALGGVAARPWRVAEAEALLAGQAPDAELFDRVAGVLTEGAHPSGQNGFKIALARRIAVRALVAAAAGTPARMPALPGSVFASEGDLTHV
ncbi:FAD binding domain-containing protein [Frigidibacter oleivorans]|uniref:FAD binding domain-containing protein n=1 Tax=Frigidibacter oleivorans TaxID=2487129 RepID=UPI000F8D598E|nr:xanthine dehydrogenase family protein subunit M [Frigidibacter oleivorans]